MIKAQIQTHYTVWDACIVMSATIVLQHNRHFYVVLQCRVLSITEWVGQKRKDMLRSSWRGLHKYDCLVLMEHGCLCLPVLNPLTRELRPSSLSQAVSYILQLLWPLKINYTCAENVLHDSALLAILAFSRLFNHAWLLRSINRPFHIKHERIH